MHEVEVKVTAPLPQSLLIALAARRVAQGVPAPRHDAAPCGLQAVRAAQGLDAVPNGWAWLRQPVRLVPAEWSPEALRVRPGGVDLRPVQRQALGEMRAARGGVLPIGVGHGKTFVALLAGAALDVDLTIILCPPGTVRQMWGEWARLEPYFRLPKIEIVPYSQLQRAPNTDLLRRLTQDIPEGRVALIADEAHNLRHAAAARTKRVQRFLEQRKDCIFVCMSGTLTSKSLKDHAHLAQWALGDRSFLPSPRSVELDRIAACVDVKGKPCQSDYAWAEVVARWGAERGVEGELPWRMLPSGGRQTLLRQITRERMVATQGVVATNDQIVPNALYLAQVEMAVPAELQEVIDRVAATQCLPDGTPIDDPIEQWRAMRQLALGYWYRWDWPGGIEDTEWLLARNEWARVVRKELDAKAEEHYDSPLLVHNRTEKEWKEGRRLHRHIAWAQWQQVKERPAPPTIPVWISGKVLDDVLAWLKGRPPTLVWYEDRAVQDGLRARGLEVIKPGDQIGEKARHVGVSIRSHGTGLNLPQWASNFVVMPPTSGAVWEQLLGRTHRTGQESDEVWTHVLVHSEAAKAAMRDALLGAQYLEHESGQQKLLLATRLTVKWDNGKDKETEDGKV